MAKSMKLGGGGRFAKLAAKVGPAVAAAIGRKKYGNKKMASMAAKGKTKVSPSNIGSHFTESAADLPIERADHFQEGNAVLAREQQLKNLGSEGRQGVDMPGPSEHGPGTQA